MDLLQFPRFSLGNIAALVIVDHCSKFLMAVPIKDKRAITVAKIVKEQILPHMIAVPNRILTDNGPEFIAAEFNQVLDQFGIKHVHSTKYKASGNGAVERSNRTIIELLKGLVNNNPLTWDKELPTALVIYNSTKHSRLGISPSHFLLTKSHDIDNPLPVDADTLETWKEGHPKFTPYKLGEKVAYKINKIGHQLKYKLGGKYLGPFEIIKIQPNGVTYEIRNSKDSDNITKVHHKQIKPWKEPPSYLKRHLEVNDGSEPEVSTKDGSSSGSCGPMPYCIFSSSHTGSSGEEGEMDSVRITSRKPKISRDHKDFLISSKRLEDSVTHPEQNVEEVAVSKQNRDITSQKKRVRIMKTMPTPTEEGAKHSHSRKSRKQSIL